jgi:sugar lactone lactonase YvrE
MTVLMSDLGLVESPRWHDGRLWFADWIAGRIIAVDGQPGGQVMIEHQSLPLCFDFLPDGTPIVVSVSSNALLQADAAGALSPYADLSGLSPYGGNDIVVDGRGNAYVDNPNYDAMGGPPPAGAVAPGWIALVTPDGAARIVADDLAFPNGIAVTADGSTVIVAESHRGRLTAFDIAADGSLGGRRVWADLGDGAAPDGICIDADGAVWYADVPNKRCVRIAEGGTVLDTVDLDRGCFACMLGGAEGDTLYIVAARWFGMQSIRGEVPWDGQVLSVAAPAVGAGWPTRT